VRRIGVVALVAVLALLAASATGHPHAGVAIGVAFALGLLAHSWACCVRELFRLWRAR